MVTVIEIYSVKPLVRASPARWQGRWWRPRGRPPGRPARRPPCDGSRAAATVRMFTVKGYLATDHGRILVPWFTVVKGCVETIFRASFFPAAEADRVLESFAAAGWPAARWVGLLERAMAMDGMQQLEASLGLARVLTSHPAHLLLTRPTKINGAFASETTMRPNPRRPSTPERGRRRPPSHRRYSRRRRRQSTSTAAARRRRAQPRTRSCSRAGWPVARGLVAPAD